MNYTEVDHGHYTGWIDSLQEGIDGLKNRPKSGRPPDIPEEKVYEIKNELSSRQTRMDYKTGRRFNCQKEWWNQDTIIPTFTDSCTSGDSNRKYHEKYM